MENNFKHTPGPWKVVQANAALATIITEPMIPGMNTSYYIISEVYAAGDIMDATANAKLIAAAPDLLKVLVGLRGNSHAMQHIDPTRMDEVIKRATE
jgi:hypothetical protein